MIFRRCSVETPQQFVYETEEKKDLKMKAGEKIIDIIKLGKVNLYTLSPFILRLTSWKFSYYHCGKREKNIRYGAKECLCNIFGPAAAQQ